MNPVAYAYNAALHCPGCAEMAGMTSEESADREGNPVGVLFSWDEGYVGECCDDCFEVWE